MLHENPLRNGMHEWPNHYGWRTQFCQSDRANNMQKYMKGIQIVLVLWIRMLAYSTIEILKKTVYWIAFPRQTNAILSTWSRSSVEYIIQTVWWFFCCSTIAHICHPIRDGARIIDAAQFKTEFVGFGTRVKNIHHMSSKKPWVRTGNTQKKVHPFLTTLGPKVNQTLVHRDIYQIQSRTLQEKKTKVCTHNISQLEIVLFVCGAHSSTLAHHRGASRADRWGRKTATNQSETMHARWSKRSRSRKCRWLWSRSDALARRLGSQTQTQTYAVIVFIRTTYVRKIVAYLRSGRLAVCTQGDDRIWSWWILPVASKQQERKTSYIHITPEHNNNIVLDFRQCVRKRMWKK